jgi:hypothetical protein
MSYIKIVFWFAFWAFPSLAVAHIVGSLAKSDSPGTSYVVTKHDMVQQDVGFFDGIRGNHRMTDLKVSLLRDGLSEPTADFLDVTNPSTFEIVVFAVIFLAPWLFILRRRYARQLAVESPKSPE